MSTPIHPLAAATPLSAQASEVQDNGVMDDLGRDAVAQAEASLLRLLEVVEAGDVEATPEQRERIRGAQMTLTALLTPRPSTALAAPPD